MLGRWLKERARQRILAEPFPDEWRAYLAAHVPCYACLSPGEQETLRDDLRIFLAEKHWEGCGGLTLTEEMQVAISAQACLLTLHLPRKHYPHVRSILVYPADFVVPERHVDELGVVTEGESVMAGEAWQAGPVVLSWQDVHESGKDADDGYHVVFHEFAHQLDMENGLADGVPDLQGRVDPDRWAKVMRTEYRALVSQARRRRPSFLDTYGAEDPSEFFAVATETFFERPLELRERHPGLYDLLAEYYGQDPADPMQRAST